MTIAQIRRRINALKHKFARELAIVKLRRLASSVADDWDPTDPPEPPQVIKRVADAGFRLFTFMHLHRYLDDTRRKGEVPYPNAIVLSLLPWADDDRYIKLLSWDLPAPATRRLAIPQNWYG